MAFKKPTIEEVGEFAKRIGYTSCNAGKWWHFYDAKNWMVGKNKMCKWKSAVWTWYYGSDQYKAVELKKKYEPKPVVKAKKEFVPVTAEEMAAIKSKSKFFKPIEPVRTRDGREKDMNDNRNRMLKELRETEKWIG